MRPLAALAAVFLASPLLLALAAATASCTQETVVLATIPQTDSGPAPAPARCTDACAAGLYCDKSSCVATAGTCQLPPIDCPETEQPVCGCDGVTYFNQCLRRANGVASDTPGECPLDGNACGGPESTACPAGAACAMLGGFPHGQCPPQIPGTCWVLPASCPDPPTSSDRWDSCGPGPACLDTCNAIRKGGVYRRAQLCQ